MTYASNTLRDALNRANSSTIATHLQKAQLGTIVAGHVPQQISGAVPAAALPFTAGPGVGVGVAAGVATVAVATGGVATGVGRPGGV